MKIAVLTDDGTNISQHFGKARYFVVLTVENGCELSREVFDRGDTLLPVPEHQDHHGLTRDIDCHGTGIAAAATHLRMIQPIQDCQVLLAGGMSWSVRECLIEAGIRPVITDIVGIEEAIEAWLNDTIVDHVELLH